MRAAAVILLARGRQSALELPRPSGRTWITGAAAGIGIGIALAVALAVG